MKKQIGNKLFFVFISLLFLFCASSQFSVSETYANWEINQDGRQIPIGVDDENNLLLFKLGEDGNRSRTWIEKISNTSSIVMNISVDINYDYFHWVSKEIDSKGNIYLIAQYPDVIYITKYNKQFNLVSSISLESNEIFNNFGTSDIYITRFGSIFLRYTYKYEILNETHANREDGLYKIETDGSIKWQLTFDSLSERNTLSVNSITEDQAEIIFFSYYNELYKIDSENGKILWKKEKETNILNIVSVYGEVCILYKEIDELTMVNVELISSKGKIKWEQKIIANLGHILVQELENKKDKIAIKVLDSRDGYITGEANESLIIYSSNGDMLSHNSIYSSVYFLYQRKYSLTYSNSFYEYHHSSTSIAGSVSTIKLYSYDAPVYIPNNTSGLVFSTTLLTLFIPIIVMLKRKKAVQ